MLRKLAKRSCVALLLRTGGAQLCGPVGQTGGCCHSVGFGSVGYLRYPTWRIARAWWFGFVFALEVGSLRLASVVIELPVCGCVGAARFSWMQLPQLICPQSSMKGVSSIDCWSRGKKWWYHVVWPELFGLLDTNDRWVVGSSMKIAWKWGKWSGKLLG